MTRPTERKKIQVRLFYILNFKILSLTILERMQSVNGSTHAGMVRQAQTNMPPQLLRKTKLDRQECVCVPFSHGCDRELKDHLTDVSQTNPSIESPWTQWNSWTMACKRPRVRSPHPAHSFVETSWNNFYGHSPSSADSRTAVVSYWRKNVH